MRLLSFALALLLIGCSSETPVADAASQDTRAPIRISWVGSPDLPVHAKPNDTAEVIATYQNGEAVSVLSEQGDWVEVRTGDRAGWVKKNELTTAAEKDAAEDNPQPKFKAMPMPVSAPSARGEIYLEADVNSDGEVIDVRVISNTTNSSPLAADNANALRGAKFHPIVIKGERQKFKYYHRVTY